MEVKIILDNQMLTMNLREKPAIRDEHRSHSDLKNLALCFIFLYIYAQHSKILDFQASLTYQLLQKLQITISFHKDSDLILNQNDERDQQEKIRRVKFIDLLIRVDLRLLNEGFCALVSSQRYRIRDQIEEIKELIKTDDIKKKKHSLLLSCLFTSSDSIILKLTESFISD